MSSVIEEYAEQYAEKYYKEHLQQEQIHTATNLLNSGASEEFVAKIIPALSIETIRQLKHSLTNA